MKRILLSLLAAVTIPPVGLFQIAMFAANGFWVGLAWLLVQLVAVSCIVLPIVSDRRRKRAQTLARANYEHAAVMRGEIGLGTYGAFPPSL